MDFVVHQRGLSDTRFSLADGANSVGRADENLVVLGATKISGEHLVLTRRGDALTLEDLGSTNGTFLNGRRTGGVVEVFSGDRIYLGDYVAWVEGALRTRPESGEVTRQEGEDDLLMVSSPLPAVAGAPHAFIQHGEEYRLQFTHLVREGLRLQRAQGQVPEEETLRACALPVGPREGGGDAYDVQQCVTSAWNVIDFVTSFSTDAMHEGWADASFREGASPLVLGADGSRVGWGERRGIGRVPLTREAVDALVRRVASSLGLLESYEATGVLETFDGAGGYVWGSCDLAGHQGAALDLRRLRHGVTAGISRDSWSAIVNELVGPTREALVAGARVLWCLRGPAPVSAAIQEIMAGMSDSLRVVCVSESGAIGRGNAAVTSLGRARISGGDPSLGERVRARFAAGCDVFVAHLWRPGSAETEAIKEALSGACGGTLVTVWADSIAEGERLLAEAAGFDAAGKKFNASFFVRVNMDKTVTLESVWDPAYLANRGGQA